MPKTKLNIFLAKQGVKITDVIRNLDPAPKKVNLGESIFCYKEVTDKKPQWLDNFFGGDLDIENLKTKTIQAAYIKTVKVSEDENRVFALTFGLGINLLKLEKFEERFGINTALNLMSIDKIRTADTNILGSNPKTKRTQLGKLSKMEDFELDEEYELIKSIGGKSEIAGNPDLLGISTVNGKMSLSISKDIKYDKIDAMLKVLFLKFQSEEYKKRFPGIDHTIEIKDKSLIDELNNEVINRLNSKPANYEGIGLSCPEIIIWEDISGFQYPGRKKVHDDLSVDQLVDAYRAKDPEYKITLHDLHNKLISTANQHGNHHRSWPVYKCLLADIRYKDSQYSLNEGKWFKFDDDYVKKVIEYYNTAELSKLKLPPCDLVNAESEGKYNKRVAATSTKFIHMDVNLMRPEKQTSFEVCDILTKDKEFLHIKKGETSANLSHLFSQGYVSADILNNHIQTRRDLVKKKKDIKGVIDPDNFMPSSYTVTFGIITKKTGARPEIPFFSKVTFRNISRTLKNMGYKVNLLKIDWK